jgi:hypothetical protein
MLCVKDDESFHGDGITGLQGLEACVVLLVLSFDVPASRSKHEIMSL